MKTERNKIAGWGNYPVMDSIIFHPQHKNEINDFVVKTDNITVRGSGRSYGDSALGTQVVSSLRCNKIINLDEVEGTITCESGVLLSEILSATIPVGFFLPVMPGTKYITVGGAIAADVHGKNHLHKQSFSAHVLEIKMLLANGDTVICSKQNNHDLFWATCGGMGLTGFVLETKIQLLKIETAYIKQQNFCCKNLGELFSAFYKQKQFEYKVGWLDCFATQENLGKSIFTGASHCFTKDLPLPKQSNLLKVKSKKQFTVPFFMPSFLINGWAIRVMNFFRFKKAKNNCQEQILPLEQFFFPLDSILQWNKLYGRKGFLQYQYVLPAPNAEQGTKEILELIAQANDKCFLAVIKQFGKCDNHTLLSFPIEGFTVALDFKFSSSLFALFGKFDEVVMKHGGRIYLAKDARMKNEMMQKGYSKLKEFQAIVKRLNPYSKFTSAQCERINY